MLFQDVGYNHGRTYFAGMMKGGGLPPFLKQVESMSKTKPVQNPNTQQSVAGYTFTDLAQMVCKVHRGHYSYGCEGNIPL